MEVEKLARKLKPLIPDQVIRWMNARETADSDLKALIDKQIAYQAQRLLGNYREKILLSLPDAIKSKGEIKLGTVVYDDEKWSCGITRKELTQHLAIFGRSGAGKTNAVFHLLKQFDDKRIPFLFLDWKRTARHISPQLREKVAFYTPGRNLAPFQFNPFIVPEGVEENVYVNFIIDVIAEAYTLGEGAKRILQQGIHGCYQTGNKTPSPDDILAFVQKLPDKDRQGSWKISTVRALESIRFAGICATDKKNQHELTKLLSIKSSIMELDGLDQSSKKFLIPMLALWIYHSKLSSPRREKLDLVIIIEEAHHVLYKQERRAKETVMNMLLRQCREIGIGAIIVDQHPHLISSAALGNTFTSICMNLKDPADITRAAGLSLLDSEDKKYLSMLPVGYGIIKLQDRWREPFLAHFPLMDVKKGSVSDEDLLLYLRSIADSGANAPNLAESGRIRRIRTADSVLNDEALRFIKDVVEFPDCGVQQRYRRIGLSGDKGNRLKGELVKKGWLESSTVPVGEHGRKLILRPSAWARETLKLACSPTGGNETLKHEYWKRWWFEEYHRKGYRVALEVPRRGGRVDVLATSPDGKERVGIEVETGMSDVVTNVKNGLLSGFTQLIVGAIDRTAFEKIERELGMAGLLGLDRVKVVIGLEK